MSTPYAPVPPTGPPPVRLPPQRPPVRTGDLVASIVLMVGGAIVFAIVAFFSLFLSMMSDGCGSGGTCRYDLMTAGFLVALLGPPAVFIASVIGTIVRLVIRRSAWWMPLLGVLAGLLVWAVGFAMLQASLGR